jgi:hypothetical protein
VKIATAIGARPQFVKAAVVSRALPLLDALNGRPAVEARPYGDWRPRASHRRNPDLAHGGRATRRRVDSSHDEGQPAGRPSHASIRDWLVGVFVRSDIVAGPLWTRSPLKVRRRCAAGCPRVDCRAPSNEVVVSARWIAD